MLLATIKSKGQRWRRAMPFIVGGGDRDNDSVLAIDRE